jgi:hypothetical protein
MRCKVVTVCYGLRNAKTSWINSFSCSFRAEENMKIVSSCVFCCHFIFKVVRKIQIISMKDYVMLKWIYCTLLLLFTRYFYSFYYLGSLLVIIGMIEVFFVNDFRSSQMYNSCEEYWNVWKSLLLLKTF